MGCRWILITFALLSEWLAFFVSVAALFSPAWVSFKFRTPVSKYSPVTALCNPVLSQGLFIECACPYSKDGAIPANTDGNITLIATHVGPDCHYYSADEPADPWQTACQVLWVIATAAMLVCAVGGFFLCCRTCKKLVYSILMTIFCFIGFGAAVSAVVVFGVEVPRDVNNQLTKYGQSTNNTKMILTINYIKETLQGDTALFNRDLEVFFDWSFYLAIIAGCLTSIALMLFAAINFTSHEKGKYV